MLVQYCGTEVLVQYCGSGLVQYCGSGLSARHLVNVSVVMRMSARHLMNVSVVVVVNVKEVESVTRVMNRGTVVSGMEWMTVGKKL